MAVRRLTNQHRYLILINDVIVSSNEIRRTEDELELDIVISVLRTSWVIELSLVKYDFKEVCEYSSDNNIRSDYSDVTVKREVVLNRARSELAGSQTNVILPSTGEEDRTIMSRHSFM